MDVCRVTMQSIVTPGGKGFKRKSLLPRLLSLCVCGIDNDEGKEEGKGTDKSDDIACDGGDFPVLLLPLLASGGLLLLTLLLLLWRE